MRRPTIRIVTAEGPITINATDFDAETMEEFTGKAAEPKSGDGDGDGEGQGDGANDPANNQTGTQAPVDPAGGSGQAPTNEEPKDPANNQTGTQAPVDPAGGSGQAPTNEEPKDPANNQTGTQAPVDPAGGSGQAPTNEEPKDPATMTWPELRSAAAAVSDTAINSKEDALEALRAHAEKTAKAD